MKKLFLLIAAACVSLTAVADEGMWMLPYLQKMNIRDMKARGCKSYHQLFVISVAHTRRLLNAFKKKGLSVSWSMVRCMKSPTS